MMNELLPELTGQYLNATTIQVEGGPELYQWREASRVAYPGAQFTTRYKKGHWDGTYAPGKWCREGPEGRWTLRGSRGLILPLRECFRLVLPQRGASPEPILPAETLYDHQEEALRRGLEERWGRIALATNAGKGAVIALVANTLFHRISGMRSLVLCDEVAVFDALVDEIVKWVGITPGRVESGIKEPPQDPVVVAMVPTLYKRITARTNGIEWQDWLEKFGAVLLDEADKATAKTWRHVLSKTINSEWRLGFSGTFPMDDLEEGNEYARFQINDLMGGLLTTAKNIEMIEQGISAKPQVVLHRWDCAPYLTIPRGRFTGAERRKHVFESGIVYNDDRHRFIASLIRDEPTCVIVNRVDHGVALAQEIPDAVFLDGKASKSKRKEVLDQFEAGEINVLVVTKILDRGSNKLGRAMDLIFASGEGSIRQTLQRIGRGLRRADGKEFLRLVDIIDRGHKHLHTAASKRVALYNQEGFDVEIV